MSRRCRNLRRAFSLLEALMATTILAMCGTAVLLGLNSALQTTTHSQEQIVAQGLAEQLLDEIAGCRYVDAGASPTHEPLGPTAAEVVGVSRERFDAIDDYNGYSVSPPVDVWGIKLGTEDGQGGLRHPRLYSTSASFLNRFRQQATVNYASAANPTVDLATGSTSNFRAVTVTITYREPEGGTRELARTRRVFTYVP